MNLGRCDAKRRKYTEDERLRLIIRALPPPSRPTREELLADSSGLERESVDPPRYSSDTRAPPGAWRTRIPAYSMLLACVVLAIVALTLIGPHIRMPSKTPVAESAPVYTTGPGGFRRITLRDGSEVTLTGSSELTLLVSEHQRRAVLTRGEVLFKATHNPEVPFQVDAGSGHIVALGTTFDVRRYSDQVDVSVAEGAVMVSPEGPEATESGSSSRQSSGNDVRARQNKTKVRAGEGVSYDANGEVGHAHPVDLKTIASWISGHRLYRGKQLAKVIEDVQLYVQQRIELDPALASVRYSGYVDQELAEQWVRGLPTIYPVEIDDSKPNRLLIRCLASGCPDLPP